MPEEQSIPCPHCQQKIIFDTRALLRGAEFRCANCGAILGLAAESKTIVEEAMQKFDEVKKNLDSAAQQRNPKSEL